MTTALSTAGWIVHDLGLAAQFGGSLFGKLALNRAVKLIRNPNERGQVLSAAWNGYNIVNAVSLGTAAATWIAGRVMLSGKEIDSTTRALVITKDALLGTSVATGLFNMISGMILASQAPGGAVPVESGHKASAETPPVAAGLQKAVNFVGTINLLASAGVIGITAVLGMKAGRAASWKLASRFLP